MNEFILNPSNVCVSNVFGVKGRRSKANVTGRPTVSAYDIYWAGGLDKVSFYLPLEVFLPWKLRLKAERHWERVAGGRVGEFRRPLRGVHEIRMSGVIDESTTIGRSRHHPEWINVAATIILDGPQLTIDAWILVGLEDRRITSLFVTLGHHTARLLRTFRRTRFIFLDTPQTFIITSSVCLHEEGWWEQSPFVNLFLTMLKVQQYRRVFTDA